VGGATPIRSNGGDINSNNSKIIKNIRVPKLIISRGLRSLIFKKGSVKMLYDRVAFILSIDRKEVLNYISYLNENSVYIFRELMPSIEDFEDLFMCLKI
jgi:hypothetical protein